LRIAAIGEIKAHGAHDCPADGFRVIKTAAGGLPHIDLGGRTFKTALCGQPALSGCGLVPVSKPGHKDKIAALRVDVGVNKEALPRSVGIKPGAIHAGVDVHHLSGVPVEFLTDVAGTVDHPQQGKLALQFFLIKAVGHQALVTVAEAQDDFADPGGGHHLGVVKFTAQGFKQVQLGCVAAVIALGGEPALLERIVGSGIGESKPGDKHELFRWHHIDELALA